MSLENGLVAIKKSNKALVVHVDKLSIERKITNKFQVLGFSIYAPETVQEETLSER